ncbi:MAG: hypothetical protein Q9184_000597 [Pyrenodesmia sp. 2 TL-2023]
MQGTGYEDNWRSIKERFPSATYSTAGLEDILNQDTTLDLNDILASGSTSHDHAYLKEGRLEDFLAGLPSATSRSDMISILRCRLISHLAKKHRCSSILYGDSTTRLAERTLSETAKGRGGSIPWLTADGPSPHGIKIVYPMRDLLRKEIAAYTTMTDPPLTPLILEGNSPVVVPSSKNTTIEDLMSQYFESVEQNYPSIVANVVRTSSRLVASITDAEGGRDCRMCSLPVTKGHEGLRWSGEQEHPNEPEVVASPPSSLCYGCARSTLDPP